MKASEFRIGNWVEFIQPKKGMYTTVEPSTFSINIEKSFKPIPLTEGWLVKFGFEWRGLGGKYLTLFTPCGKALVYIDGYVRFTNTTIETPIQYVHQLQNLYFALTGEELMLQENVTEELETNKG